VVLSFQYEWGKSGLSRSKGFLKTGSSCVRGKGGRTGVERGEKKREEDIKYPET
jgi:hypothetical protein